MSAKAARRLSLRHLVWLLVPLFVLAMASMEWVERTTKLHDQSSLIEDVSLAFGFFWFVLLGALVVSRQPKNPMGWILVSVGTMISVFPSSYALAGYVVASGHAPSLWIRLLAWPNNWYWYLVLLLIMVYTPLFFPNGRLLSKRWRPVAWLAGFGAGLVSLLGALADKIQLETGHILDNPIGIHGLDYVEDLPIAGALFGFLGACIFASAVSVVLRFRRSRGEERQQLKWFVFAISLLPASLLLDSLHLGDVVESVAFGLTLNAIPIAIGVAILRYRLYDIDIVINKTVVYGALAAFITAVYAGVVVGIGSLIGSGDEPNLALSLVATGFVAVAFQPVRGRVQRLANRLVYGQRLSPYEAVTSFSHRMADSLSFDEVLPSVAEAAASAVGGDRAMAKLLFPGGSSEEVLWPADQPSDSFDASVSVVHQGKQVGEIAVAKKKGEQLTQAEQKLLADLASQAGLAFSNLRLTEELKAKLVELQESRRRIVSAQDEERRRMERDIHDGAQQQLVSMSVKLGLAKSLASKDPEKASAILEEIKSESSEVVETLRDLARGLFPQVLSEQGLVPAVAAHVDKMRIPATVDADSFPRLAPEAEAALYFVIREALQNASKYASGAEISVSFSFHDDRASFSISDRGPGFDVTAVKLGAGIQNMRDRIEAIGGNFEIRSEAGTEITGSVPVGSLLQARG